MFDDKELISIYGSWVRVQVEFYDFIFTHALELCPKHFRKYALEAAASGLFADDEEFYELQVKRLEDAFPSSIDAWSLFKKESIKESKQKENKNVQGYEHEEFQKKDKGS